MKRGLLCLMARGFCNSLVTLATGQAPPLRGRRRCWMLWGGFVLRARLARVSLVVFLRPDVVFLHPRLPAESVSLGRWLVVAERREKGGEGRKGTRRLAFPDHFLLSSPADCCCR